MFCLVRDKKARSFFKYFMMCSSEKKSCVLLSTAYWGPVQYYAKLYQYPEVLLEQYDHYMKQTYRNRCLIAGPDGVLPLTVPVVKPDQPKLPMKDIRISDHGNWRHLHWNALESAYRNSAFFEYYADDFRPFYEQKWTFLMDFNEAIQQKVCALLDLEPHIVRTDSYQKNDELPHHVADFREEIHPKHDFHTDCSFDARPYYQVFRERHGFLPNLSIADLLFNMGPEGLLVLRNTCKNE